MSDILQLIPKDRETVQQLRKHADEMRASRTAYAEFMMEWAYRRRVAYNAYVAEGFTRLEALELVKTI